MKKLTAITLICLCACTLLSACKKKEAPPEITAEPSAEITETLKAPQTEPPVSETPKAESNNADAAPGTLLESGTGLNENYYKNIDFYGLASDVTDSSFTLAKDGMAYDSKSQPIVTPFTVSYDENTLVRASVLYYSKDSYELYAGALGDLKLFSGNPEFMFDVIVEDLSAETLYAKEVRVSRMVLD